MDGEPTLPARSRRAPVALLLAGAVVLLATAVGVAAALGGRHDSQPDGQAGEAAAGAPVASQDTGATMAGGGSGGQAGGGTGGGGTSRTTTSRPTTTSSPATTEAPTTTAPQLEVYATSWQRSSQCDQQPDGRWHFTVKLVVGIYTRGAGTVRYQWGRGGGDARSNVRTFTIDEAFVGHTSLHQVTDTISGSAPSPTDTVIDRLHVLDPPGPTPRPAAEMTPKVCP